MLQTPEPSLNFILNLFCKLLQNMSEICLWSSPRPSESFMAVGYVDKYHVLELGKTLNPELEYMV